MGKYTYVASIVKNTSLRKKDSLKERRYRLGIEISRLMKVLDRKLQEERLLLTTLEIERMDISDRKPEVNRIELMLKRMEIVGENI